MNPRLKSCRLVLPAFFLLTWTAWTGLWPARKIYWHFTMKATWGEKAQERAWITMVEMPKEQAYPEETAQARSLGGQLRGNILAQVRATAFRSTFEHEIQGMRCHDLTEVFEESPDELTTVEFKHWHGFRVNIRYCIRRSPEREHPFWKQMRMN